MDTICSSDEVYDHKHLTMEGLTEVDDLSLPISHDAGCKQVEMLRHLYNNPEVIVISQIYLYCILVTWTCSLCSLFV